MSFTPAVRSLVLFLLLPPTAFSPVEGQQRHELREVARFGWEVIGDSTRPLTARERTHAGGVLGDPVDIAEGKDGRLYILDRGFQKVAVFRPDGGFDGLILGGSGEGPGEFSLPRSLSLGPGDDLWVFDQKARRIIRFDSSGAPSAHLSVASVPAVDFIATEDLLYVVRLTRDSSHTTLVLDTLGQTVARIAAPTSEDLAALGKAGMIPALGHTPDRRLIMGHPTVGTFSLLDGVELSQRRGTPLFPDAVPEPHVDRRSGVRSVHRPVEIWQVGALSNGLVFLVFARSDAPGQRPVFRLAFFDPRGRHVGTLARDFDNPVIAHSLAEPAFFIYETDPYPQIVKYELVAGGG